MSQATEASGALRAMRKWLLMLAALCLARGALSADAAGSVADRLKQTLHERFPTIRIDVVQPAPIAGLYEVIAGDQVVYTDPAGDYVVVGRMMDARTHQDLSAEHLAALRSIDFKTLPLDKAIRVVRGSGARKLAEFADPDCPYCRELEHSLEAVPDVTVYVFLFPLDALHPHATEHAHAIWCSANPGAAWTAWLLRQQPMPSRDCAGDPVPQIRELARSLHIDSTPTVFLESGKRVDGAVSPAELGRLLALAAPNPAPAGAPRLAQAPRGPARQPPPP
jgi:thiol:disulfide interchange protein DsbC